ncbi:uncharacterized protein DUF4123 [Alkalispirillum mobile]|uniref:Uncharacterized protein DUF4123 n=1 Tax=Alkalispirillum mobile TaxID=85925 RepID=A0A498BVZ2_9GAMM|nr:DUF4123 domain-containing protein [Alkalispirillum mobile]RLK46546.1 uncharacterized protein DUF4123 [Alkalispirillum mobile]
MTVTTLPVGTPPSQVAIDNGTHYLLLDGIALEPLERWLYQQLDTPRHEPLYLHTPLAECRNLSPCLVALEADTPLWKPFMEQGAAVGWGWLMASEASLPEVAEHLRWLLFVEHPGQGEKILRVASPRVMQCLLEAEPEPSQSPLLGVIEALWLPTTEDGNVTWRYVARAPNDSHPGAPTPPRKRFNLQPAHLESLSRIARQQFAGELAQHLETYFANGPLLRECGTALASARQVINITRHLGFEGRRAHYYMANILGTHGQAALDQQRMPELARLLNQTDNRPPMARLKAALAEAQRLASRENSA